MMSSRLAYCILFSAVIRVSLAIWDHTMSVLKLSRSASERRSGSFLEAGAALRDF